VAVGTAAGVKEVGSGTVELVAILDPDRALSRPGIHAGERSVATWMEAASWAGPKGSGGRVLVQTRHPGHPAVQALVRWDPVPFLEGEARRRMEGGFPPGHPVFRVEGPDGLEEALRGAGGEPLVAAPAGDGRVCLLTIHPAFLGEFRSRVLRLASEGSVTRVEAEPQL
jgi:primosomal protein N'